MDKRETFEEAADILRKLEDLRRHDGFCVLCGFFDSAVSRMKDEMVEATDDQDTVHKKHMVSGALANSPREIVDTQIHRLRAIVKNGREES